MTKDAVTEAEEQWRNSFSAAVNGIPGGMTPVESANRLRAVIKTDLLKLTDIVDRPKRFFEAHRLLMGGGNAVRAGPGFGIRFTVHFNLFAGTVVALGTPSQIAALLTRNEASPRLGCFALTEALAGVNSGLVVQTTAVFENGGFTINTPAPSAQKFWISQGLTADEAVVIADLSVNGANYGPQAFLVPMRDAEGNLLPGIEAEDMGGKTVGNDLDNARLTFNKLKVPLGALLARYLCVTPDGTVSLPSGAKHTMEVVGQRLFTGRVAVAAAALEFAKSLLVNTKAFADNKQCWTPKGSRPLSAVPQIRAMLREGEAQLARLCNLVERVEAELCSCLRGDKIPPRKLQQAIAVAKVKCVEGCIEVVQALQQEVGSFALMRGSGFEQIDFVQCCKFAEGDSRILMQKMARDIVRGGVSKAQGGERKGLMSLGSALQQAMTNQGLTKFEAWEECWRHVYALAELHMGRVLEEYGCSPPPAPRL